MQDSVDTGTPPLDTATPHERLTGRWRVVPVALCGLTLTYFVIYFRESVWQPTVDLAWLLAVLCWIAGMWSAQRSRAPRVPHPYWFYALYAVVLMPFATDWRWAMTGDSTSWVTVGMHLADKGPSKSLLSLRGVAQFGYGQQALHNIFMVLIEPTLFWHRVGQIMIGVASMAAMVAAYGRLVSRNFGLLVAACTLSTSVMIVHTYCSYPLLDAVLSGHAVLAATLWIRQDPTTRRAWLVLGVFTGLLFHLTANGVIMGLCAWLWLVPVALYRRWPWRNLLIAAGTALIVALPALMQMALGQGDQLFSLVEKPEYTVEKVYRFFREALTLPFWSNNQVAGAFGPQLPPYFRYLFVPGILLAPLLTRYFPGALMMAVFFVMHAALLALMQGPYPNVSVKRALVLIPMATYFVFIPWHRYLRALPVVLVVFAVWASFGVRNMLYDFRPGRTGYTLLDGLVEANQRFSDAPVCVYLPTDLRAELFAPGSEMDRIYRFHPHIQRVSDVDDPACARYLCYSPQADSLDLEALGYEAIPMLGTTELRCGRK